MKKRTTTSLDKVKIEMMETFSLQVESLVELKKLSYLEAILENFKINSIEIDPNDTKLKNLLTPSIQAKLYQEASDMNMIKKKTLLN